MNIIVNDDGFTTEQWPLVFFTFEQVIALPEEQRFAMAVDLPNNFDVDKLEPFIDQIDLIRIEFPSFSDGRAFSLAQLLRLNGYTGRLRAKGHILADQYAMARRSGFDDVEIGQDIADRQPESQWLARTEWKALDYQQRLGLKRLDFAAI